MARFRRRRRRRSRRMGQFAQTSPRNWRHYYQAHGAVITTENQPYRLLSADGPAAGVRLMKEITVHVAAVGIPDTTAPYRRANWWVFWAKKIEGETINADWWATNKEDSERVWAPIPVGYQSGPYQPEVTRTLRFPKIALGKGFHFGLYAVSQDVATSGQTYITGTAHWMEAYRGDNSAADVEELVNRSQTHPCLLYTSPSPRDRTRSRMPSSA